MVSGLDVHRFNSILFQRTLTATVDKEQVVSFINKLQIAFQKIEVRRNEPEDQSGAEIID